MGGCEHDKGTSSACSSNAYNYGYRDPQANFRSIMAYNCASGQCDGNAGGGCTRAQRFSNTFAQYNSKPMGTSTIDNARHINDVRQQIAAYYNSDSSPVSSPPTPAPTPAPTPPTSCTNVDVVITTDNYPAETTWTIKDSSNTELDSGGPYTTKSTEQEISTTCLSTGTYTFEILDSYGDGICCSYGSGSYSVEANGEVLVSGGEFGSVDTKTFQVSSGPSTPAPTSAPTPTPPTTSPTPAPFSTVPAPTPHPTGKAPTPWPTHLPPTPYPTGTAP